MNKTEVVNRTLDALVAEAYEQALARGVAITNPDGWRAWKRKVYIDTARREGPGYLRAHHARLGLTATRHLARTCDKCDAHVITITTRDDQPDAIFCSYTCAGITTMTLDEWLEQHATPEQRASMERIRRRQEGAA